MVNTLLGKIENLFEKDFLFASFLPMLLFVACLFLLVGDVLGFRNCISLWESFTGNQQAVIAAGAGFWILILAYLVFGLRTWFLRLWSGTIEGPFEFLFSPGKWLFSGRFRNLRKESTQYTEWENVSETLQGVVSPLWKASGAEISQQEYRKLLDEVTNLDEQIGSKSVERFIKEALGEAYKKYHGNGLLKDVYRALKVKLQDWAKAEQMGIVRKRGELDRRFGDSFSIRPTALGNVVESYNSYSFKRYGLEGEVFWPHLEQVIPETFRGRIRDVKILLDFFLTMATLGIGVSIFSLLVGPWIMFDQWYWSLVGLGAFIISYNVYYKMAVFVAIQYGDLIRASYDLFRLDLLYDLYMDHPANRDDEQAKWKQLSKLVVFGQTEGYEIRKRKSS